MALGTFIAGKNTAAAGGTSHMATSREVAQGCSDTAAAEGNSWCEHSVAGSSQPKVFTEQLYNGPPQVPGRRPLLA